MFKELQSLHVVSRYKRYRVFSQRLKTGSDVAGLFQTEAAATNGSAVANRTSDSRDG